MKKLSFFLVVSLLSLCANAQIVNIPDVNFKNKLLASTTSNGTAKDAFGNSIKIDTNNNGEVEISETLNVVSLNVAPFSLNNPGNIANVQGIQSFSNLKLFKCWGNQITGLDVSGLVYLQEIDCSNNHIQNINCSGLSALKILNCSYNNISNLNTLASNNLETLNLKSNPISAVDLSVISHLITYDCAFTNFTTVDVTGLSSLKYLYCNNNQLTNLFIQNLSSLVELTCNDSHLMSLNLTGLTHLTYLEVSNNLLSSADFSMLASITYLSCGQNPMTSINLNGLITLNQLLMNNTLVQIIDCSQSGVRQLSCSDSPNLSYINVKNSIFSYSDPDMLYFTFVFENLPTLTSICVDNGEQSNLNYTNYNSSGNVTVYTGTNCATVVVVVPMATTDFKTNSGFSLYPNPADNIVTIKAKESAVQSVQIYNTLGQLMQSVPNKNSELTAIDVSHLITGTYFINIISDKGKSTQRFIKL